MSGQQIIMNFTTPPDMDDLAAIANDCVQNLPDELQEHCEKLGIEVEELADDVLVEDSGLDDPYDLILCLKRGNQLSPGVETKVANDDDILTLFRRPLLDYWCETYDDLGDLVRQLIIEELGQNFEFSDDEIDDMTSRNYQSSL